MGRFADSSLPHASADFNRPSPHSDEIGQGEMRDDSEFVKLLEQQALRYRGILEDIFGPCDPRFVFGSIKKSTDKDDVPCTNFPNGFHLEGGCVVDIHISECPWQNCYHNQGTWQVAHESVHLLDPGEYGTATVLEEGLATWFQNETKYHSGVVREYIKRGIKLNPAIKRQKN